MQKLLDESNVEPPTVTAVITKSLADELAEKSIQNGFFKRMSFLMGLQANPPIVSAP